jgi:hypothetical protein
VPGGPAVKGAGPRYRTEKDRHNLPAFG